MNVVLIRGTSGSGKTWIAERVIERLGGLGAATEIPVGEKKVGAYVWQDPPVTLMGRYGNACGGCDTLTWAGAADVVEATVIEQAQLGRSVLMEGLSISSYGVDRWLRVCKHAPFTVVHLDIPLEQCIESVKARRLASGRTYKKPFDPENTRLKYKSVLASNKSNRAAGINVESLDRAAARARVFQLLGL